MKQMLRKKEVIDAVGMAKSTVSDWIYDFQIYIPTVKQGAVTYYLPEAIDVLLTVKELREQNYAKPDIMRMLGERGFSITIDDEDQKLTPLKRQTGSEEILKIIGESMQQIGEQNARLDRQDGRIDELTEIVQELQKELAATQEQLAAERKKNFIQRLFGR